MSDRGGELGRAAGRAGALGLLRAAPRGPAPAAGRARRPAPTGERPAAFSATCLPGPSEAPIPLSLLFLPPPATPGRAGGGGGADGAARRVFSARASRIWGRRRRRCALARTFPRRTGHKDFGARCSPDPHPRGVEGGHAGERPPALGLAGSGHSPGRVAALAGKARARKGQVVRLEAAERSTRSRTLTPHNSAPRESRKTSGANSVCPDRLLVSPAVDSKLIKHETDPSLSQL